MVGLSLQPTRWLYLHGFASGPESAKGVQLSRHFAQRGTAIERLDLRVPSLENLRLAAMIEKTRRAVGGPGDRAVLFGSSLGGLVAGRVAEIDDRVEALVLLAPAFRFAERWASRPEFEIWREQGWIDAYDYVGMRPARIDFAFATEALELDSAGGGWPDVRVPTLIVHGVHDDVVPVEVSRRWAAGKSQVRLVEVDDGHDLIRSLGRIMAESERFLDRFLEPAANA